MINLKLAEYKDGKFERFLELGKDFLFGGDSIIVSGCSVEELIEYMDPIFKKDYFKRDEKDPLNRFNGLFDGRTYGNGRFVLIKDDEDTRKEYFPIIYYADGRSKINFYIDPTSLNAAFNPEISETKIIRGDFRILGNLHENPELWEKVK